MAFPATFDREKNTIDEFMLKEYESIASAHFDSQSGLRQQFRFYLLIAAVPITVLGLAFKDRSVAEIDTVRLFNLPHPLGVVFLAIGVLGLLMVLSMIHTALDATLYARTVNGIRSYFVERGGALSVELRQYLKMPTQQNRPRYFHIRAFFWQVALMAGINTAYIAIGVRGLYPSISICISFLLILVVFGGQLTAYLLFCRQREKEEVPVEFQ